MGCESLGKECTVLKHTKTWVRQNGMRPKDRRGHPNPDMVHRPEIEEHRRAVMRRADEIWPDVEKRTCGDGCECDEIADAKPLATTKPSPKTVAAVWRAPEGCTWEVQGTVDVATAVYPGRCVSKGDDLVAHETEPAGLVMTISEHERHLLSDAVLAELDADGRG